MSFLSHTTLCVTPPVTILSFLTSHQKKMQESNLGNFSKINSLIRSHANAHLNIHNWIFQVLNAVLFQPVSYSSYHIYCKYITETIPEKPYNLWNGTRYLFPNKLLFPDKLSNFGGKTLQATSFQLAPFTYQNADGSRGGWEYSVMASLAEKLNFKLDINPPPNGELWGENKNGTFTG